MSLKSCSFCSLCDDGCDLGTFINSEVPFKAGNDLKSPICTGCICALFRWCAERDFTTDVPCGLSQVDLGHKDSAFYRDVCHWNGITVHEEMVFFRTGSFSKPLLECLPFFSTLYHEAFGDRFETCMKSMRCIVVSQELRAQFHDADVLDLLWYSKIGNNDMEDISDFYIEHVTDWPLADRLTLCVRWKLCRTTMSFVEPCKVGEGNIAVPTCGDSRINLNYWDSCVTSCAACTHL